MKRYEVTIYNSQCLDKFHDIIEVPNACSRKKVENFYRYIFSQPVSDRTSSLGQFTNQMHDVLDEISSIDVISTTKTKYVCYDGCHKKMNIFAKSKEGALFTWLLNMPENDINQFIIGRDHIEDWEALESYETYAYFKKREKVGNENIICVERDVTFISNFYGQF